MRPKTGNRGAALFLLGLLLLLSGIGNFVQPPDSPSAKANLAIITSVVPYTGLLVVWLLVGLYALVAAWSAKLQPVAYGAVTVLFFFMGFGEGLGWVLGHGVRAWYVALLYLMLAGATFVISGWEERA